MNQEEEEEQIVGADEEENTNSINKNLDRGDKMDSGESEVEGDD
jgi:hypothetical protein